jgi:hypothetical protein
MTEYVTVYLNKTIGTNKLSLGIAITMGEMEDWYSKTPLQARARDCGFTFIRVRVGGDPPDFYWGNTWDEATKTGTYDWREFDPMLQSIYNIGAEPLLGVTPPTGMTMDWNNTGFPNPEDFAIYVSDIARHCLDEGWNIRYWEVLNNPEEKAVWKAFEGRTEYSVNYINFFNVVQESIHSIFPNAKVGSTAFGYKGYLRDYVIPHALGVGWIGSMKYDNRGVPIYNPSEYYSDEETLKRAGSYDSVYDILEPTSPSELIEMWRQVKGTDIDFLVTETNLNEVWQKGTDPRIQQIFGAVWYAEELRYFITEGLDFSVWFNFASAGVLRETGGLGFGMMKSKPEYELWYPYWTNYLMGNNLEVGDTIYEASSSNFSAISVLAWKHIEQCNILLIYKVKNELATVTVQISGLQIPQEATVTIYKIDNATCGIQTEVVAYSDPLTIAMDSYCIALLTIQ